MSATDDVHESTAVVSEEKEIKINKKRESAVEAVLMTTPDYSGGGIRKRGRGSFGSTLEKRSSFSPDPLDRPLHQRDNRRHSSGSGGYGRGRDRDGNRGGSGRKSWGNAEKPKFLSNVVERPVKSEMAEPVELTKALLKSVIDYKDEGDTNFKRNFPFCLFCFFFHSFIACFILQPYTPELADNLKKVAKVLVDSKVPQVHTHTQLIYLSSFTLICCPSATSFIKGFGELRGGYS